MPAAPPPVRLPGIASDRRTDECVARSGCGCAPANEVAGMGFGVTRSLRSAGRHGGYEYDAGRDGTPVCNG